MQLLPCIAQHHGQPTWSSCDIPFSAEHACSYVRITNTTSKAYKGVSIVAALSCSIKQSQLCTPSISETCLCYVSSSRYLLGLWYVSEDSSQHDGGQHWFWHSENCKPPSTLTGAILASKILQTVQVLGPITEFKAYVDISLMAKWGNGDPMPSELQSSGVSLIHCPHNGGKDVVDKMLIGENYFLLVRFLQPLWNFLVHSWYLSFCSGASSFGTDIDSRPHCWR